MASSNSPEKRDQSVPLMDYPCPSAPPHPVVSEPRGHQNVSDATGVQPVKVPKHFSAGLEHLVNVEQLSVEPAYDGFITLTKRRFRITNNVGEEIYRAILGPWPYNLLLTDTSDSPIIEMRLLPTSTLCGLWCATNALQVVSSSDGTLVGVIQRELSFFGPLLFVENSRGETVMKVEPSCTPGFFSITSSDGLVPLGEITRELGGFGLQVKYKIRFSRDMDVHMKTLILALCVWLIQISIK